jgi:hypothetical protein
MPNLLQRLEQLGRTLLRWRAELKLTWGLAAIAAWVFLLGMVDLWLRLERSNRLAAWTILLALAVGTLWLAFNALRQRFTHEGIAATVEKTFPQLDNRLINYLQFARDSGGDPFKEAYVRSEAPPWEDLDFKRMRDERAHRRSRRALGIFAVVLMLPLLFFGQAWAVAVWRTVNPFSTVQPPSLTKIISVTPGTATVVQGERLQLECLVKGYDGHEVRLDLEPADGRKSTLALGRIKGSAEQTFSHTLPKVGTGLRYRFRAGDAPSPAWYTLTTRPPAAFTELALTIAPPAYMKRSPRTVKAREGRPLIPAGSEVTVVAASNVPLSSLTLGVAGAAPVTFAPAREPNVWQAKTVLSSGTVMHLSATDAFEAPLVEDIAFALEPDQRPGIVIVSPKGRASLPPGERPQIEFSVSDDYGLSEVTLEEVPPDAAKEAKGTVLKGWRNATGNNAFHQVWKSETSPVRGREIAYRVVARDNRPGQPNVAYSPIVVFSAQTSAEAAKKRDELEKAALANLARILELQTQNLKETTRFQSSLKETTEAQWTEATERQGEIRNLTRLVLANPLKPLAGLTAVAEQLYANEMVLAIDALKSIPASNADRKVVLAGEAVALEGKILRQLSVAATAIGGSKIDRRVAGLSALLETLIRDQSKALEQTRGFAGSQAKVGRPLVEAQDQVGENMSAFLSACKEEATQAAQGDVAFAETLTKLSERAAELKIREDMVMAAERLERHKATEAVTFQQRALANLKSLQALLEQIKLQKEGEKREAMLDAVKQAQEKLAKMEALHTKVREAMDQVAAQKDKNTEAVDQFEEEYKAIVKNTKEAMLEIPTDLQIFTDLNVANDLVEDVISVFQEIEQKLDSDKDTPDKVKELGFAKEDELLAQMGEASKRLDAMEMWLGEKPDELKVTTEAHDKAEMPASGIALAELAAAAQDLVSDLLKEDAKTAAKADDSATNHAMPDVPAGWEVMEGDIASFAAQGKSGNQTPDHKEQDGRSNVGRQGMSNGETAASSGTIGEGDKNIEARRTNDPVQSGQINLAGEADTKATGGGKLGTGKADGLGMSGGAERIDSKEAGSWEGMAALMAKRADEIFVKASLKNVRVDSLQEAAHQLRQSGDTVAKGNIEQARELRKMAASSLVRAQAQLKAGPSGAVEAKSSAGPLAHVVESGPDMAPPQFRNQVAEYFKALNSDF